MAATLNVYLSGPTRADGETWTATHVYFDGVMAALVRPDGSYEWVPTWEIKAVIPTDSEPVRLHPPEIRAQKRA